MSMLVLANDILRVLCLSSCLRAFIFGAVTVSSQLYRSKESHVVPEGWICIGRSPPDHAIRLEIGLKPGRFQELEQKLYEVSDPSHRHFGKHLTAEETYKLVKASKDTVEAITNWLYENGVTETHLSLSQDWITVTTKVHVAESLFNTRYYVFLYKDDNTLLIRTQQWSLPSYLYDHIDIVQPTTSFFRGKHLGNQLESQNVPRSLGDDHETTGCPTLNQLAEYFEGEPEQNIDLFNIPEDLTVEQACNSSVVSPLCIRVLYGFVNYTPQVPHLNQMALVNFLGGFNNRSDINMFLELYRPDAAAEKAAYSFTSKNIAGAINQQTPANAEQLKLGKGREGNLDAGIMLGLAWPTPLTAYSTGGRSPFLADPSIPSNTNEPFLTWLQYVLAQKNLPNVISISYGEDEQTVPYAYAKRVCNGFAQLGARGVTVLVVSGDFGVGETGSCVSNDGKGTRSFLPSYPGTCPYVTTVGATRNIDPEVVAWDEKNGFVTGGGFSNYFTRPSYQAQAVSTYIEGLGSLHEGMYNRSGRGYPDVATQGYHYIGVWNGTREGLVFDGTSASAPTMASIVALVNDALIAEGRPPLGFLNPWLYSQGFRAFTDITQGSTKGCNTSGFPAKVGWDAASGFGTPVSTTYLNYFMTKHPRADIIIMTPSGFPIFGKWPCLHAFAIRYLGTINWVGGYEKPVFPVVRVVTHRKSFKDLQGEAQDTLMSTKWDLTGLIWFDLAIEMSMGF